MAEETLNIHLGEIRKSDCLLSSNYSEDIFFRDVDPDPHSFGSVDPGV